MCTLLTYSYLKTTENISDLHNMHEQDKQDRYKGK